jgi:hypothetical protein
VLQVLCFWLPFTHFLSLRIVSLSLPINFSYFNISLIMLLRIPSVLIIVLI